MAAESGSAATHQLRIFEREVRIAIQHALWDVILVYRLLPFPLCAMRDQDGMVVPQSMADDLPCSEPTTPVRRKW